MRMSRLAALLDWDAIVDLAGSLHLQRGMGYLEDGRVGPIRATDDAIEATVLGTLRRVSGSARACRPEPGSVAPRCSMRRLWAAAWCPDELDIRCSSE